MQLYRAALLYAHSVQRITLIYVAMTSVICFIEWRLGRPLEQYRTRAHLNQFLWYIFRNSGVHDVLLFVWFYHAMDHFLPFLKLHIMDSAPVPFRFLVIFLFVDLAQYWLHRLRHAVPLLWTFHAVHHAPESLTPAGMDLVHPVDDYVVGFFTYPLLLVLGADPGWWAAAVVVRKFTEFMQHTEISWRFGVLYPIFVSPAFHRVHHSKSKEFHDKNFGTHLSIWDYVFGTAAKPALIPEDYGVENLVMPTVMSQVFGPFRIVYDEYSGKARRGNPISAGLAAEEHSG